MCGMLKFDSEVIFPAVVDGGVGDAVGAEFGSEGDACAIERERVVGDGNAIDGHEARSGDRRRGSWGTNLFLVVAEQAEERERLGAEASSDRRWCSGRAGNEQKMVDDGERGEQEGELLPGDGGRRRGGRRMCGVRMKEARRPSRPPKETIVKICRRRVWRKTGGIAWRTWCLRGCRGADPVATLPEVGSSKEACPT